MDLAHVGFDVDSSDLKTGQTELEKFGSKGQQVARKIDASADQMGRSLSTAAGQASALTPAIANSGAAAAAYGGHMQGAAGQTANLTAQLNDIGLMMASGQSPLMLAMQQGSQVNQVFDQMRASGRGVGAGLVAAFSSFLNPLNFATLGIIAGGAALFQWATAADEAKDTARTLGERLDDLSSAVSDYRDLADQAAASSDEMSARFLSAADGASQVTSFLAEFARVEALDELNASVEAIVDQFGDFALASDQMRAGARAGDLALPYAMLRDELELTNEQAILLYDAFRNLSAAEGVDGQAVAAIALNEAFLSVYGSIEQIPPELREAAKSTGLLALSAADLQGASEEAAQATNEIASNAQSAYEAYARLRTEGEANLASNRELLNTLNDEAQLAVAIASYGAESAEVAALRADQEREAFVAMVNSRDATEQMKREMIAAYDVKVLFANTDIAGGIGAAANEASRLAGNMGLALSAAMALQTSRAGLADEDAAMAVPVLQTSATRDANRRYAESIREVTSALSGGGGGGGGLSEAAREAKKRVEELERAINDWANRTRTPWEEYKDGMVALNNILAQSPEFAETYGRAVAELNEELADSIPMVNDVSDAFGDFVARGFSDFKGFVQDIWGSFQGLLSDMVAQAAKQTIMFSMGITGGLPSGAGGVASLGAGLNGIAGAIPGLGGLLGSFGTGAGFAGLAGGAGFLGGLGNVVGGFASGGFSGAAAGFSTAMSGGFASALGGMVPIIGGITLAFQALKGKTELLDKGFEVTVDQFGASIQEFEKTRKKYLFGLISGSSSTALSDAPDEIVQTFNLALADMQSGVTAAASTLGFGADAFDDFTSQVKISTAGMSEDEAIRAVEGALGEIGDEFANMIPGLERFIEVGETSRAALDRLATSFEAVNQVVDVFGNPFEAPVRDLSDAYNEILAITGARNGYVADAEEFYSLVDQGAISAGLLALAVNRVNTAYSDSALILADYASDLVDLFGGLDQFNAATSAYYNAFFSEEEKLNILLAQTTEEMQRLGLTMPTTRDAYRDLVESQDLATESGREAFASLIGMAGAFDTLIPLVEATTESFEGMIGALADDLSELISSYRTGERLAEQNASVWLRTSENLYDYARDMRGTISAIVSASEAQAFNEAQFQTTLASALAGDQDAASGLTDAAAALLDSAGRTASSATQLALTEARVRNGVEAAAVVADGQVSIAEQQAAYMGQQVTLLTDIRDLLSDDPELLDIRAINLALTEVTGTGLRGNPINDMLVALQNMATQLAELKEEQRQLGLLTAENTGESARLARKQDALTT